MGKTIMAISVIASDLHEGATPNANKRKRWRHDDHMDSNDNNNDNDNDNDIDNNNDSDEVKLKPTPALCMPLALPSLDTSLQLKTLIVAPLTLLDQWHSEIKTKTRLHSCIYYGKYVCMNE